MMEVYRETGGNIIGVEACDPADTAKYGIVGVGENVGSGFRITGMIEKPDPSNAPSNLYINGRYILHPEIFAHLARHDRGAGNEIQLTDAMIRLLAEQPFYGRRYTGGPMIAVPSSAFSQPISPSRSTVPISPPS